MVVESLKPWSMEMLFRVFIKDWLAVLMSLDESTNCSMLQARSRITMTCWSRSILQGKPLWALLWQVQCTNLTWSWTKTHWPQDLVKEIIPLNVHRLLATQGHQIRSQQLMCFPTTISKRTLWILASVICSSCQPRSLRIWEKRKSKTRLNMKQILDFLANKWKLLK